MGVLSIALFVLLAGVAQAQEVQVDVFGGYRFGGDLFETIAGTPLDIDGAPVFGVALAVFVDNSQSVTFLYSRQEARVDVPRPDGPARATFLVDHWHVGGAQEINLGVVRPFYGAGLGLTRFGSAIDTEVRFSFDVGGGAKMMFSRHLGAHLGARGYGVVVNGQIATACVNGLCSTRIHAHLAWQIEFAAGLVVAFGESPAPNP